jgi:hypothetical protein
MPLARAAALLAVAIASAARADRFHVGMGLGAGTGPGDTGAYLCGTIVAGYSLLPWMDVRFALFRHTNHLFNFVGESRELRTVAALAGLHIHARLTGPIDLIAAASVGAGRISEPLPIVFGSLAGRSTDLAWQTAAGFRVVAGKGWIAFEWVTTQFAHYPNADRLAYVEGRIDGPVISVGVAIF